MTQTVKSYARLGVIACLALSTWVGAGWSQPRSKYGLGHPPSSGGAIRGCMPQVVAIAPADGARTFDPHPTVFWYIVPNSGEIADGTPIQLSFILRDRTSEAAQRVFTAIGTLSKQGVYKFTPPTTAPALVKDSTQRWDLRLSTQACGDTFITLNSVIQLEQNPLVVEAAKKAETSLQQARIYAEAGYWYDALAAYDTWLNEHPVDEKAQQEKRDLLKEGLKDIDRTIPIDQLVKMQAVPTSLVLQIP